MCGWGGGGGGGGGILKHLGDVVLHRSSGFSLSQFILFLHVIPDRLMMIRSLCGAQTFIWIITINGKMNVWKCKLIFPADTLQ